MARHTRQRVGASECAPVPLGPSYLSLGVSWQRLMSGTEVTPQRLYCPSPMERDTSSTPKTRPSLKRGENTQTPSARSRGHGTHDLTSEAGDGTKRKARPAGSTSLTSADVPDLACETQGSVLSLRRGRWPTRLLSWHLGPAAHEREQRPPLAAAHMAALARPVDWPTAQSQTSTLTGLGCGPGFVCHLLFNLKLLQ